MLRVACAALHKAILQANDRKLFTKKLFCNHSQANFLIINHLYFLPYPPFQLCLVPVMYSSVDFTVPPQNAFVNFSRLLWNSLLQVHIPK